MNAQDDPTRERQGNGKSQPQSRILVFRMLDEAGSQGCTSGELIEAIMRECSVSLGGAKAVLFKGKKKGLIYGKGVYSGGCGMQFYRYFATAAQCEAYVFEGVRTLEERMAHKRESARLREERKRAQETPEQCARRKAERNERLRAAIWKKKGYDEPPPKRAVLMTAEQRAQMTAARLQALARSKEEREAAREAKRQAKERAAQARGAPGKRLVVKVDEVAAPVSVVKRPVLVGEPIITSQTRVTIAPVGRDYRYWVDPEAVRPVFGALRFGEYLTEVCDAG